ncbi:MAG: DNA polymerase III subunit gamma/tau [Bacteroidota bacterium]
MSNFVVSARKYRPAVFEHVVGQSHITTTLKNAIKDKHLAQAFLFCGPRGVGKTTCARILAKTINCEQVTTETEPCNTCSSCTSFNQSSSLNVYELDAASNNSVEDIRTLVEQVRYAPQTGQYKVYIIDEVHMLSNAAFNAFLKTLEEPPGYAIFILATTEKHKIIPTILSRCQIFDFHRIQPQDIVQQLKHIAAQENIAYEEEALHLIAQRADGALRDALSIFDLITTFAAGRPVSYQATLQHLHILDYTYYFKLTEAFLQQEPAAALLLYDEILKAGFDGYHFLTGLTEHFRNLLVSQDAAGLSLVATAESVKAQYQAQAAQAGKNFLYRALTITNEFVLQYKASNNKRLHVELALIELAHLSEPSKSTIQQPPPIKSDLPPTLPQAASTIKKTIPQQATPPTSVTSTVKKSVPAKAAAPKPATPPRAAETASPPPSTTLQSTGKLPKLDELKKAVSEPTPPVATPEPQQSETARQPLTQAAIKPHWQAYVQNLKERGKMSEYSLLNQGFALEDSQIVVQLVNTVQQDTLTGIQEELVAYLRAQLQRTDIGLKGVVVELKKNSKPYTAQEKFNYLTQKYPALRTLQEQLSLEVKD